MLYFCICFCDFWENSVETKSWHQSKETTNSMKYISIQSVKCVFLEVFEILNLQVSVKGQIPGSHCYNQLFQLVYFYGKRKSQSRYLHMVFISISRHFLSDCSLASSSKCKLFLGWEMTCPTAPSFQGIQAWSYKIKGRHLVKKCLVSHLHISYLCQEFLPHGSTMPQYKWCISWVLAMEITQFVIWLIWVWASHSLSKHWRCLTELKSCLGKYRNPV